MTDDNNQDMEVEDILASIKSILEEDQAIAKEPEEQLVSSDAVEIDDILELSPDMRLAPEVENTDINLSAELDEVEIPHLSEDILSSDIDETSNSNEMSLNMSLGSEDYDSDPFYEEETTNKINIDDEPVVALEPEDEPVVALEPEDEPIVALEPEDEPVVALEPEAEPLVALEPEDEPIEALEPEAEPVVALEPEAEPLVALEPEAEPIEALEPEAEPIEALESEAEPLVALEPEDEPIVALEPEDEPIVALEPEAEPVVALEPEKEDASVDIINNFAKMFAQEETPKPEVVAAPVAEPIKILGDGSKTIEDVVSSVIKQIIGEEVATNWKNGLDYDVLARQEIQRQTKEWLDNNLPAVVEKIVKQEIERVMAKVGTGL